ncbi:hypothetical protein MRX96_045911 [Rhipicephalus microplus]
MVSEPCPRLLMPKKSRGSVQFISNSRSCWPSERQLCRRCSYARKCAPHAGDHGVLSAIACFQLHFRRKQVVLVARWCFLYCGYGICATSASTGGCGHCVSTTRLRKHQVPTATCEDLSWTAEPSMEFLRVLQSLHPRIRVRRTMHVFAPSRCALDFPVREGSHLRSSCERVHPSAVVHCPSFRWP